MKTILVQVFKKINCIEKKWNAKIYVEKKKNVKKYRRKKLFRKKNIWKWFEKLDYEIVEFLISVNVWKNA